MRLKLALIFFIVGLLSIHFFSVLPTTYLCLLIGGMGVSLIPWRTYPLGLFLLGVGWGCYCALCAISDRLDPAFDGMSIWLEGTVVGLPEQSQQVVRFQLENTQSTETKLPSRIRLAWYKGDKVKTGERWRLLVRLKYPRGTVNPYSFDYEAWLTTKYIGATGTVKQAKRLTEAQGMVTWRYRLREAILDHSSLDQGASLVALVLGDGSGISQHTWRILQETGTIHLMVISGQHITLLAGFMYFCIAWLAKRGFWPKRLPWLPFACGFAMLGALTYSALAGFGVPIQRSCIMLALVLLWRLRFRSLGVVTPFLITLAIVLAYDPLASLQAGFWLSFGAVAILLLGFTGRLSRSNWWLNAIRAEWFITIGLFPVLLTLLLPVSLTAPIANLIAVPIVSIIVVPLALLGSVCIAIPMLGDGLLWLASYALKILFIILTFVAQVIPAWIPPIAPLWATCLAFLGVFLLLLPKGLPIRIFGGIFCLPLFFPPSVDRVEGCADITVFDVGQGLAVLVRTKNHNLLYDTGPRFGDFNLGERVVVPALLRHGVNSLDLLIVSHMDADHAGGLVAVNRRLMPEQIIAGELTKLLPKDLTITQCESGKTWLWDNVKFSLWRWQQAKIGNDSSCVLMVEANGEKLLLTGDISSKVERAWLAENGSQKITWLLAPHHGSRLASSWYFLQRVIPDNIIISRGWLNPFNHPHPTILTRYHKVKANVLDTAKTGALSIKLGQYLPVKRQRDVKYFWQYE